MSKPSTTTLLGFGFVARPVAITGDVGRGAGAGAAIGGIMGGAKRHEETNECS